MRHVILSSSPSLAAALERQFAAQAKRSKFQRYIRRIAALGVYREPHGDCVATARRAFAMMMDGRGVPDFGGR